MDTPLEKLPKIYSMSMLFLVFVFIFLSLPNSVVTITHLRWFRSHAGISGVMKCLIKGTESCSCVQDCMP